MTEVTIPLEELPGPKKRDGVDWSEFKLGLAYPPNCGGKANDPFNDNEDLI